MSVLAALALLVADTEAPANRWWFLFADDQAAWFADGLTATQNKGIADLTYERVHRSPRGRMVRARIRAQIDCEQKRIRTVSADVYDLRNRQITMSQSGNPEWRYFLPNSDDEALRQYACKGTEEWAKLGSSSIFREPLAVGLDYYRLVGLGMRPKDAIGLARYNRKTQLSDIRDFIDLRTRGELRMRVLKMYQLPGAPDI